MAKMTNTNNLPNIASMTLDCDQLLISKQPQQHIWTLAYVFQFFPCSISQSCSTYKVWFSLSLSYSYYLFIYSSIYL